MSKFMAIQENTVFVWREAQRSPRRACWGGALGFLT